MEYFQYRYYRVVEALLTIIGQWPHQSAFHSLGFVVVTLLLACSVVVPQVAAVMKYRDNIVIVLECVLELMVVSVIITTMVCSIWNGQKIGELLNRIHTDWRVWDRSREVDILHKYAEQGREFIVVYSVFFYSMAFIYMTQPMISKIMDILLKNGSTPGEFPIPLSYNYFDEQKYYFYIHAHIFVSLCMGLMISTPFVMMIVVSVQHGSGIFVAVGHKLNAIGQNKNIVKNKVCDSGLVKKDVVFEELVWCIKRHNEAIEYANLIESTYSWYFFLTLGLNMIMISVAGYQIVTGTSSSVKAARLVIPSIVALAHVSIECYHGQFLMDHSIRISYSIYSSNWYEQTSRVQNLLYSMMICCKEPSTLTAGKICTMGLETLVQIFKTSMSGLTILRSM